MIALPVSEAHDRALATLGAMVSRVAHETRNILGSIELHALLLAEQCATLPDLAPVSARLLAGVKQLGAVTGNLLSVTRRAEIEPLPVDLGRIVLETVESAQLALRGTGIRLGRQLAPGKTWILGDGERLRQAFLNIVLNAVQAMPEGGALTVGLRAARERVALSVADTGAGMDRATLRRATEPFFTTRPNGTGLGLAVVREVAACHGARLRLASRPGAGTTVRLSFPLAGSHGVAR